MSEKKTTYSAVIGSIVSNSRKSLGKEQSEIAAVLGITQASYSRLESGKSSMTTDQIFLISKALQLTPSSLLLQVENSIKALESNGFIVVPQLRGSNTDNAGKVIVGAALGALLMGVLARK